MYLVHSCHLQKISASVFHGLKSLKCLWMTNNFIKHLDKNLLKDNVYSEELHINKNEIESWTLDISHLKYLTLIDCSRNKLTTLPKSVRDSLDAISKNKTVIVNLKYNKIICTCKNLDFLDWMFKTRVRVILPEGIQCVGFKGNISYGYNYI